jgi:hypothetical protein
MVDTTDIEKKSLEAHVELCAERYRFLEQKLETVESNVEEVKTMVKDVHGVVHTMAEKRQDQLVAWGGAIIATLVALVGWFVLQMLGGT